MRTLSVSVSAQIDQALTAPGYLLEMLFSSPVRLCSRGDVTVLGNDWLAWGFAVTGIGVDATSATQGGSLSIDNPELDISTLILEEGIADRAIRIYTFYGDDPQDADPVLLFDGVGGDVEIDTNVTAIKVSLRQAKDGVQYAPAKYITVEQGFSMLPPPGTVIVFGGQSYVLQPESFCEMATYPGFNQALGSQQDAVDDRTIDQDVGGGVHVRGWFPARKSRFTIKHILTKDAFFALMTFYDLHRFDFFDFAWDLDDATYTCVFASPPVCVPTEPQVLNVTVALRELQAMAAQTYDPNLPSIGAAPASSDLANVPNLPAGGSGSSYVGSLDYILSLTGNGNYVDPAVPRSTLNKTSRKNSQQQAMIAGAGSILPLLYGRRRVGGRIAGVQVTGGLLYLLVVWCYGTTAGVSAIESVEVSNAITTSNVTNYLGNQVAPDPTLVNAKRLEHLVYADVLPGICYSVVGIASSKTSGFPTLNATVRGFKVASVNGGVKAYSTVPAYIVADFITNADYGLGGLVNWTDVAALAARNNQMVGGAVRNQLDVLLDTPQTKRTWLAVLCDYAGCFPFKEGDTWRLVLDAPATSVVSLGPDRIVGGTLKLSKKDIGNSPTVVQVTYTDNTKTPWADAQATAYAPGVLDGTTTRRLTQIAKPGITRYAEAYRYAVERLNEALVSDLSCTFAMFDDGLSLEIGDVFDLTHPIGLSAKLFRCLKLDPAQPGRWNVSGLEYDDAKYSNDVATGPSSMDSTLPSPLIVPNVVGLNVVEDVYQIQTGRYASRLIITWQGPTTADYASGGIAYFGYVLLDGYDVLITQGTKQSSYAVPHDQLKFVTDALPENLPYTVQVRARSALVEGAWSTFNITNNGKQTIPSDVPVITGYSTNGETRLTWGAATDLDLTGYEIRYGLTTDTWATALFTAFVAFPGNTLNTTLIPSGLRRIFIKALDSVRSATFPQGQPSANAASCDITVTPNTVSNYTNFDPGAPILTLMSAQSGGWMTDTASIWNTLFPLAMTNYPAPLATYHAAGISGLVSQTVDLGGIINATVISNLQYLNLSGIAQPYIEYKANVGDAWTRVNAQVAVGSMRYVRVGVTAVLGTDTIFVSTLGVISVGVDATQNFIQYSIFNDISAWVGAN